MRNWFNKRITKEHRVAYKAATGEEFPENRQSGKTTGLALLIIGQAMSNPGIEIFIAQEFNESQDNRRSALDRVRGITKKLGLEYISINLDRYSITYKVFGDSLNDRR